MGYYLEDKLTGERLPAVISRLSRKEVMLIHKSKRFHFKWNKEADFEVYGLRIDATGEIVGVVSIECNRDECAVKVRLNTGTAMFSNTVNSKILIQKYHESSDQEGIEGY